MIDELSLLQTARLEGRPTLETLVITLGADQASVEAVVQEAVDVELVAERQSLDGWSTMASSPRMRRSP